MDKEILYYMGQAKVQKFGYSSLLIIITKALRMLGVKEKEKVDVFFDPRNKQIIIRKPEESLLQKTILKIGEYNE